jgi:hypothetical protein
MGCRVAGDAMSNEFGTIYLTGPWAPGEQQWHQGYIRNHTAAGAWVFPNNFTSDGGTFYPADKIARIKMGH